MGIKNMMTLYSAIADYLEEVRNGEEPAHHASSIWKVRVPIIGYMDIRGTFKYGKVEETVETADSVSAILAARGMKSLNAIEIKLDLEQETNLVLMASNFELLADKMSIFRLVTVKNGLNERNFMLITDEPHLMGLLTEHNERLKANALRLVDGNPSVILDQKIRIYAAGDREDTHDGAMIAIRGKVAPFLMKRLVPACMAGTVPLTVRMLSWTDNRLGKANMNLITEDEFKARWLKEIGTEWTANDPAILACSKTVKNSKAGETITVDILIHKVNAKGGITEQRMDHKEMLINKWTSLSKANITEMLAEKSAKVALMLSSKDAMIDGILKTDHKEIGKMAAKENGDTDIALMTKLTNFSELVRSGIDISLLPMETDMFIMKKVMNASTISERGIRVANTMHDGDIVDGKRFWIALPMTTVQTLPEVEMGSFSDIATHKVCKEFNLYRKTEKLGWIKIKRSPVTRGARTIPFEKILWLKGGETMLVCKELMKLANADCDGDTFTLTWENATLVEEPADIFAASNELRKELEAKMANGAVGSANEYSTVRELMHEANLSEKMRNWLVGKIAARKVGIFSNLALDIHNVHGIDKLGLPMMRELVDLLNEGIIKAVKHADKASFWSSKAIKTMWGLTHLDSRIWSNRDVRKPEFVGIGFFEYMKGATGLNWVLAPVAKNLGTVTFDWYLNLAADRKVEIAAIEKAMKTVTLRVPDIFNWVDGRFPSMERVLKMDPTLEHSVGKFCVRFNKSAAGYPMDSMIGALSRNGDQSELVAKVRAWDATNAKLYPMGAILLLCRLWNATRPDSTVAFFNSGRNLASEWRIVAEWIRLSK